MPESSTTATLTTPSGHKIFTRQWAASGSPKAVLVITHGIGDHSGRYENHAAALTAAGYALIAYDIRGHGNTEGVRGSVRNHGVLLEDLQHVINAAREAYPGLPLVLFGHSMGGNIALHFAHRHPQGIAAVVATSPWLRLSFAPPAHLVLIGRLLKVLSPTFPLVSPLDPTGVSRDLAEVEKYKNDPLIHDKVSAGLGIDAMLIGEWLLTYASQMTLPLYIAHGSGDRLTSPAASAEYFEKASSTVKKRVVYEGWYHELHHELEKDQFFEDLIAWLDSIITP